MPSPPIRIAAALVVSLTAPTQLDATPADETQAHEASAHETPVHETALLAALEGDETLTSLLEAPARRARANAQAALLIEAPRVEVAREAADDEIEWTWAVRFTPPRPDRRRLTRARGDAEVASAEQAATDQRTNLRARLREAYADWSVAVARHRTQDAFANALNQLAEAASARAEAGEIPGITARRLVLAGQRGQQQAARYRADAIAARGRIEALVGPLRQGAMPAATTWSTNARATGATPLPPVPAPPGSPSAEAHPRLAVARLDAEATRLDATLAGRIARLPEIGAGWRRVEVPGDDLDGPVVEIGWRVPLPGRRKVARAAAQAETDAADARLERAIQTVDATRRAAHARYAHLHALTATTPADDPSLRDAAILAYQLGESDLTDLLDTLESLVAMTFERLDLVAETLAAHRDLERAIGRPLELLP